jgi:hypothetical protein
MIVDRAKTTDLNVIFGVLEIGLESKTQTRILIFPASNLNRVWRNGTSQKLGRKLEVLTSSASQVRMMQVGIWVTGMTGELWPTSETLGKPAYHSPNPTHKAQLLVPSDCLERPQLGRSLLQPLVDSSQGLQVVKGKWYRVSNLRGDIYRQFYPPQAGLHHSLKQMRSRNYTPRAHWQSQTHVNCFVL